jgi:hypothetical protein
VRYGGDGAEAIFRSTPSPLGLWVGRVSTIFAITGIGYDFYNGVSHLSDGNPDSAWIDFTSGSAGGLLFGAGVYVTAPGVSFTLAASGAGGATLGGTIVGAAGIGVIGVQIAIFIAMVDNLNDTLDHNLQAGYDAEQNGECGFLLNQYLKAKANCAP